MMKKSTVWTNGILIILLFATILFALTHGASKINFSQLSNSQLNILFNIRLPRIISALVAGAALSASGAFFQSALRNPIADPSIMGVSSAASLFQMLSVFVLPGIFFARILFAILGGLLAFLLVLLFQKKMKPYQLIIIGVALSAMFSGIQEVFAPSEKLSSLATSNWGSTLYLAIFCILGIIAVIVLMESANYLKVNDAELSSLGLSPERLRLILLLVATFLAATVTACVGVIAFLGIIVPQTARLIVGYDYQKIIPFSLLAGSWLLLFIDTVARTVAAPNELATDALLAIIGGPFMILILLRRKKIA